MAAEPPDRAAGHPFGTDYADPRTEEQRAADREAVMLQLADLTQGTEPGSRDGLLRLLERRAGGSSTDDPSVQFDFILDVGGDDALVVPGDCLVSTEAAEDQAREGLDVRQTLRDAGYVESPLPGSVADVPELAGRVTRFVNEQMRSQDIADFARQLRDQGSEVSAHYVTLLAGGKKGAVVKVSATPSQGARSFSAGAGRVAATGADGRLVLAVIDTGIAEEVRSDGWLDHGAIAREPGNIDVLDRYPLEPPPGGDGYLDAGTGHGTFVAGIIQQVCPNAEIRMYRGPDSDGIASEAQVAAAMVNAVRDGADIVNLSLGCRSVGAEPPVALAAAMDAIAEIEATTGREVLLVAAAGNNGDKVPVWPAAFPRVVAVAGLSADGSPAPEWSTHGPWVDCATVGEGVVSTFLAGTQDPAFLPTGDGNFGENSWATWTGTSFAAPQISGAVARLCEEGGLTPRDALTELLARGVPATDFGQTLVILPGT